MAAYPRVLRDKERDLLESVLPGDRPGYAAYREHLGILQVIGAGRRGEGNFLLGEAGSIPDLASPLPPVIAYGIVETTRDRFTVTVREIAGGQIDVEIVSLHGEPIPDHFEEKRRWTYSTWRPGEPSPATGLPVREVRLDSVRTLIVAPADRRLWLYDAETGMNLPLPVTGYHNELMLLLGIRDPKVALRADRFFEQHEAYPDADLRTAFISYNTVRRRVSLDVPSQVQPSRGFRDRLAELFQRGKSHG